MAKMGTGLVCLFLASVPASGKTVIAHRGASGYLPEHTLEAFAFAYAQGAHYLEPDLVLTRDGQIVILHDRTLDATTDVAKRFPGRARGDGGYYAIDLTMAEIKQLRVRERVRTDTGEETYPGRWPNRHAAIHFQVPTLAELVELVQGLNHSTGRNVGICPEIKAPAWHAAQGRDFEKKLLDELARHGYKTAEDPVFIQSFDPGSLRRMRDKGTQIRLVQLIGAMSLHDHMATAGGLDEIAGYADGIAPAIERLFNRDGSPVNGNFLVREARARNLAVYPYTARADRLPPFAESFGQLVEKILFEAAADGVFSDHPGLAVEMMK